MDIKHLNEILSKVIDEVFVSDDFFTSNELDKIAIELRHGESSGAIGLKDWAVSIYVTGKEGNDGEFAWLSEPLRTETLSSIADEIESNNVEDFIDLSFTPTTVSDKLSAEATAKKYPHLVEEIDGNYYWQIKFVLEGSLDESLNETKEVLPIECAKEYTKEELDKIDGELKFVKTDTHLLGAPEIPLNNPVHVYQFFFKGIDKHANLETIDNENFQCVGVFKNKGLNETIAEALNEETIEDAKAIVNDYQIDDIIDYTDLENVAEDLAVSNGYLIYGESGTGDCLVKKVKNMPHIDEQASGLDFSNEEDNEKVQTAIELFARRLEQDYGDDFVIMGRSAGYWGLNDVYSHIEISERGYEKLAELLLNRFNKLDREAYPTLSDVMLVDDRDFGIELVNDSDNFQFTKAYKEKMESLVKDIENEEKAMNTKEYWEQF